MVGGHAGKSMVGSETLTHKVSWLAWQWCDSLRYACLDSRPGKGANEGREKWEDDQPDEAGKVS